MHIHNWTPWHPLNDGRAFRTCTKCGTSQTK